MLFTFVIWIYLLFLSFIYGHMLVRFGEWLLKTDDRTPLHAVPVVLMGFCLLTSLASLWYHVDQLGVVVNSVLLGIAGLYILWQRKSLSLHISYYWQSLQVRPRHIYFTLGLGLAAFVALVFSASPPAYYDDGLYYWQFIKWMNEYAIVPGLGNLHPRLAFNSNWHLLSATFSMSFLGQGTFTDLNGLLHLLIVIYAFDGVKGLLNKEYTISNALQASLIIPTHLIVGYFNAPSADVAVVYFIWVAFVMLLQKIETATLGQFDRYSLVIIALCTYVCTVKLSAFAIGIIPIYLTLKELTKGKGSHVAISAIIALLIALPWLGRNLVLSGYLFFPFYQLDLFSFDWKVPQALVIEEASYIEAFAINAFLPYPEVNEMGFAEWFPTWLSSLRASNKGILALVMLLAVGHLSLFFVGIMKKGRTFFQQQEGYILLFITLFAGMAFWFFKAPDFRFGYAFTVALYLISFSFLVVRLLNNRRYNRLAMLGFMGLIALFYLRPVQIGASHYYYLVKAGQPHLLHPGTPPALEEASYRTPAGLVLYKATNNDQCWNSPLPCTPFPETGITLRHPQKGLQGGFRITQPNIAHYREMQLYYQPLPDKESRKPKPKEEPEVAPALEVQKTSDSTE